MRTADRLQQTHEQETLQENDDDRLKKDYQEEVMIACQYKRNQPWFWSLLEILVGRWYGHLARLTTSRKSLKVASDDVWSVHSLDYRARVSTRHFAAIRVDRVLKLYIIKSATTEPLISVVFLPKKDCSFQVYVRYRKLSAVIVRDSYLLPRMDNCIDVCRKARIFQLSIRTQTTGR